MADEYVESVTLEVNGTEITDFNKVSENEFEVRRAVNLMNKTGFTKTTPRYGAKVDYAIPSTQTPFDFKEVENGTLTIDRGNGKRITYGGVFATKIGEISYGEKEASQSIEFGATET
jgi:hypothetical protein